jgi:hypothetical protein
MRSGETIVEVLMALFIVATGSATATALIVSSIQSNAFSRDNLIALNLAVEGLESVRNIRDSNWLKFGYDKTNCWNMMPTVGAPPAPPTSCTPDDLIKAGNYTASLDTGTMAWNLSSVDAGALNLRNEDLVNDQYILYFKDINPAVDSDGDGNATNDKDMYIAGAATNPASSFYRMITISYPAGTPNPPQGATEMTITSLVQWKTGEVHQIRIQTKLTNYQKVKVS